MAILSFGKAFHGRMFGSLSTTHSKAIHKIDSNHPLPIRPNSQFPASIGLRYPFHNSNTRLKKTSASTVAKKNVFSNSSKKQSKNGPHRLQPSSSNPSNLRVVIIMPQDPFSAVSEILPDNTVSYSLWMKFKLVWGVQGRSGLMRSGVLRRARNLIS